MQKAPALIELSRIGLASSAGLPDGLFNFVLPAFGKSGFVSVKNATLDRLGVGKSETVISTAEGVM